MTECLQTMHKAVACSTEGARSARPILAGSSTPAIFWVVPPVTHVTEDIATGYGYIGEPLVRPTFVARRVMTHVTEDILVGG